MNLYDVKRDDEKELSKEENDVMLMNLTNQVTHREERMFNSVKLKLKSSLKTPLLNDLLTENIDSTDDYEPFVFNCVETRKRQSELDVDVDLANKRAKCGGSSSSGGDLTFRLDLDDTQSGSSNLNDYYEISPTSTKKIETLGSDNALFLAVARAILYKLHFIDKKYKYIMQQIYSSTLKLNADFKFNSDMKLQETLRSNLCDYWLDFVYNGEFTSSECKYSKYFTNAFEFIYQIYQISVNNYARNRLFSRFAVEDLAEILKIKICTFEMGAEAAENQHTSNGQNNYQTKIYEPNESDRLRSNDVVYMLVNNADKVKYKWLMPVKTKETFASSLARVNSKQTSLFFKLKPSYMRYVILTERARLYDRFDAQFLNKNLNYSLFLKFLSECSVHTLVSLSNLNFDLFTRSNDSFQIIKYLNQLWGQNHFSLKEILNQIQFDNELERIQKENKEFFHQVFKYSNYTLLNNHCFSSMAVKIPYHDDNDDDETWNPSSSSSHVKKNPRTNFSIETVHQPQKDADSKIKKQKLFETTTSMPIDYSTKSKDKNRTGPKTETSTRNTATQKPHINPEPSSDSQLAYAQHFKELNSMEKSSYSASEDAKYTDTIEPKQKISTSCPEFTRPFYLNSFLQNLTHLNQTINLMNPFLNQLANDSSDTLNIQGASASVNTSPGLSAHLRESHIQESNNSKAHNGHKRSLKMCLNTFHQKPVTKDPKKDSAS